MSATLEQYAKPLVFEMPGLCNVTAPMAGRRHRWFDADEIGLELRLSEICGDHSCQVGFRNGSPIEFHRLRVHNLPKLDYDEWPTMVFTDLPTPKSTQRRDALRPADWHSFDTLNCANQTRQCKWLSRNTLRESHD